MNPSFNNGSYYENLETVSWMLSPAQTPIQSCNILNSKARNGCRFGADLLRGFLIWVSFLQCLESDDYSIIISPK
jgi:hypothetical protein